MRNERIRKILAEIPAETKIFVKHYANIIKRVHDILESKNMTQKQLAAALGKSPSEISKWLNSENHNITLASIAKLEAALQEPILSIVDTPVSEFQKIKIESAKIPILCSAV